MDFLNSAQDGKTLKQRKEGIFYWIPSYPSSSKLPYLFTFAPQLNVTWTTWRGLKTWKMSQSGNIMLKAAWTTVSAFLVKAINSLTDSVMSQWKKKLYTNMCKQYRVQKNRKSGASQPSSNLTAWQLPRCYKKKFISKLDEINM